MTALFWIATAILLLSMFGIGGMKLIGNEEGIEQAKRLGYHKIMIPIGIAEVLAGVGVLLGALVEDLQWLGMAAAAGVIALMIGALATHLRAGDKFENIPAIVVGAAAVIYLLTIGG